MTPKYKLPAKPSEILHTAVKNFSAIDRTKYIPTYHVFHDTTRKPGVCRICLSGAVMAVTLETPPTASVDPSQLVSNGHLTYDDVMTLIALDQARTGNWEQFFHNVYTGREEPHIQNLLNQLAQIPPVCPLFTTWDDLDQHLAYITKCAELISSQGL